MAPWTDIEKAFCVRLYTKTGSILQTQQKFRHQFNLRKCPAKNSIIRWSEKFATFGSTENRNRKRAGQPTNSGRPKTTTTTENAATVLQSVQADREKSITRKSRELGLSTKHGKSVNKTSSNFCISSDFTESSPSLNFLVHNCFPVAPTGPVINVVSKQVFSSLMLILFK